MGSVMAQSPPSCDQDGSRCCPVGEAPSRLHTVALDQLCVSVREEPELSGETEVIFEGLL